MTTRFVAFGCWNENCCDTSTPVYQVLNAIHHEADLNFSLVLGDNYYPKKDKASSNKFANIDQLSESFQLLAKSLFGEAASEASLAASEEAREVSLAAREASLAVAREVSLAALPEEREGKEIFLLLGNHDVEQTFEVNNPSLGCYVTIFEKKFAEAFNRLSPKNKILFPPPELVMFKQIGTHTLIIMIDTNIYSGENLDCYSNLLTSTNVQELQELQATTISNHLSEKARLKNIIVCGHNPLIGFKNQSVKTDKTTGTSKVKGGLDICAPQLYELMLSLQTHGENFYYLCADIHNFQEGNVTIMRGESDQMQIHQYIVGIGGTELDADYDEGYNPGFSKENQTKRSGILTADVEVMESLSLKYNIVGHFSEFGYLVGEIHENGLIEFLPKIPSLLETSRGGKRRKRKSKRKSKRNGKRTKRNKKIYKNKKLT